MKRLYNECRNVFMLVITFGAIQYFSTSDDQISPCSILLFVHVTQTVFGGQHKSPMKPLTQC